MISSRDEHTYCAIQTLCNGHDIRSFHPNSLAPRAGMKFLHRQTIVYANAEPNVLLHGRNNINKTTDRREHLVSSNALCAHAFDKANEWALFHELKKESIHAIHACSGLYTNSISSGHYSLAPAVIPCAQKPDPRVEGTLHSTSSGRSVRERQAHRARWQGHWTPPALGAEAPRWVLESTREAPSSCPPCTAGVRCRCPHTPSCNTSLG